ncbi:alpha/beta fold hydrolase [Paenibacillus thermotolerans]|uniref:alpha/beta fold hydrolase n=1 Tax=Paenibacillus thermotolerans TaxID=3027807 RepID=UPI0023684BDE|nr:MULTISPECIES: alpha/beta fold hydrolase [unclassified Paenibacillus]
MARVFLIGSTGYVGKEILRSLVRQNHEVLALVRPGKEGSLNRLSSIGLPVGTPVKALTGDLTEPSLGLSPEDRREALKAEIIIHAGGPMRLDLSEEEANEHILRAVDHVLELAEEIHERGGLARFVHLVGFMSPFHDGSDLISDEQALSEFLPKASPYERAKCLADLRVRQAALRSGFALTVIHPATVIGSGKTGETEQTGGFGLIVDAVRRGLMGVTPGGAGHWLPLVTVDDVARTAVKAATCVDAANRTYYSLDRNGPDMVRLLRMVADELRMPRPKFSMPLPMMRSVMEHGGGRLTGILPQSLDFVTEKRFPDAVAFTETAEILPAVIADLDYRLSRRNIAISNSSVNVNGNRRFERIRLGRMAGLLRTGRGNPWVIAHGLFSNADEMVPLAEALGGDDPVYVLDLPGFGRSPLPRSGEDYEAGQIEAVIMALKAIPGKVRLVGHSYGALLAARAATICPDKVLELQLMQPPLQRPRLPRPLSVIGRYPALTRKLLRLGVTELSLKQGFNDSAGMPGGYAGRVLADMTSPRVRYATAESYKVLSGGYSGILLEGIKVPIHLIWGVKDESFPVNWSRQAVQTHTHVRLTTFEFGHQFPISHPAEAAAALRQFSG